MVDSTRVVLLTLGVLQFFAGSAGACFIVGDLNGDCQVGIDDLLLVANQWLSPGICSEQGLVGHWKLDEEIGTDAVDYSGEDRHGVVFGEALWNPEGGKTGGTLQFDGTDDYVEITDYKGITGSNPRTCAAWIKSTSANGEIITWGQLGTPTYRWVIRLDAEGLLRLEVGAGSAIGSTILTDNLWHHVAVVSDGTTTDNVRLYVDGQIEVISSLVSQSINTPATNDVKIGIFADTQRYFQGLIDDVRIYDRVVSSGQIWALANTGTTDFACVDLNADDTLDATDFARLAEYWNEERPPIIISEFLADNDRVLSTHVEGREEYPDWIEIFNNTTETIDLSNWHLTDRADVGGKWRFPEGITLGSGDYLIVFASKKEEDDYPGNYPYVDDDGFLHTNFKLSNNGEYLGLVGPDASTVMYEYNSFELGVDEFGYPSQQEDISYGFYYGDHRYFWEPSPGTVNRSPFDGLVEEPVVSHPGGCYVNGFDLTVTCETEGAIIRYTTDGTPPNLANGMTYTEPIRIDSFTHLMVKGLKAGFKRSDAVIHSYIFLDSDVRGFSSNLPIVVIDTNGQAIQQTSFKQLYAVVMDTDKGGRALITDSADFSGWGGIKIRGSSSTMFPKKQFAFEVWDQHKEDKDVSILGMPSESDWILYAPYSDKSLMRNHLSYKWSNDIGQYAVRTRFVEMYLNTNGGKITAADYAGVYVFMEKIKRDGDRVDIARLDPSDNLEPEVSGGYIIKKDRLDPGDSGFLTSIGQRLAYVEPKEEEITQPQADWLKGYLDDFESALYGGDYRDPVEGYARYIDVDSWIDSHLLVELTKNIDGYRLSVFMFKDRGEKFKMGPIWDYNLSLGNADYLQGWLPEGWYYPLLGSSDYPWYPRIFEDPLFKLRYADRWYDLRRNMFSAGRLLGDVNETAAFLAESQERNYVRWPVLGKYVWPNWYIAATYQDEIDWMKGWIADRLTWMDDRIGTQYAAKPPVYSRNNYQVGGGFDLEITSPSGTIYYTVDGSDPRSDTGSVSASAIEYTDSIALDRSWQVKARSLSGNDWSAYNDVIFSIGPVARSLRINEIMYHPAEPNGFGVEVEFVELTNIGDASVNLNMVRFTDGIDFTFGDVWLPAGEEVVVVRDQAAFLSHYDTFAGAIAGEYTGGLDNGGERITLVDATGQKIHNFTYSDDWYDITDGGGFSLVIKDPTHMVLDHVEPGLKGHWKFDEYSGQSAQDSSPSGHDGVVNGGAVWHSYGGQINGALQLDGVDDYVEITGYKGILGSNPRTSTAWIKTTDSGVIMNWGAIGPSVRWRTVVDSAGRLRQEVGGGAIVGSTVLTDGTWHHVAVASDGGNIKNVVLYVDGKRDVPSSVGDRTIDTQSDGDATIGVALDIYYAGLIDNVSLYDRVLSDAEIALLVDLDDYWENKRYWRPSAQMGGSPGEDDPDIIPELGSIVINEVLAHSHALDPDWIELYNATADQTIDIGGWFLSDGKGDYMKYRIPDTTTLGPGEYIVFLETFDFDSFALSENGDEVYLRSGLDENGDITGYYEEEVFGASQTNVSLGRYQKSTGAFNFVAMSEQTAGAANADPRVGPVVISEIMYHPVPGGTFDKEEYEYVELYNTTNSAVPLYEYDADVGQNIPWKFTDGIEYTFPLGTEIGPYGYLLVVKNTTAFADRHGSPAGVEVLGPYDKNLNNNGEKLEISMPGDTDEEGRHYIRIDRVVYNDAGDWPQSADGGGMSLTRIDKTAYGNDVINWQAATGSPGE